MSRETEAKFLVGDPVSLAAIRAMRELAGFSLSDGEDIAVQDVYYDTPKRALLAAGWALRGRTVGGTVLVTAKSVVAVSGPVHDREELEIRLEKFDQPHGWPRSELRRLVLSLTGREHLVPLLEVHQRRFVRRLAQGERTAAEMSLDQVRLLAGGREREYCELEVELLPAGSRGDLSSIIMDLGRETSLVPSPRSKFEEALVLLDGSVGREPPRAGVRAEPADDVVHLEAMGDTTEEAALGELRRLGYRFRARSRKHEARAYYDTQGGALLRQGLELYSTSGDSRWHLVRRGRPQHAQRGGRNGPSADGPIARALAPVVQSHPYIRYLEAVLRESSYFLFSLSAPRLDLLTRQWQLHSPLHEAPPHSALTLSLGRGQASSFDRDYLQGLLAGALRLTELSQPFLRFGLARLGVPLPGASLPRDFLPADADDVATVCRKVLGGEAWRMRANTPGAIRDLDPEFVHDLRVATRRARFACRLFAEVLGLEDRDRLKAELSWIAGLLGGVRDMDVLKGRLDSQLSLVDADPSFLTAINGLLEGKRHAARDELVPSLSSPRFTALLDLMKSGAPGRPATEQAGAGSAQEYARQRIGKALRKIAPWTRLSAAELSALELHRLRILFKRLRYTAEFFRSILGEDIAALVKACVVYQDCLGLHQDARVAADVLVGLGAEPVLREPPERLLTLGALVQVQRDVMRAQRERFQALWQSAEKLLELAPGRSGRADR